MAQARSALLNYKRLTAGELMIGQVAGNPWPCYRDLLRRFGFRKGAILTLLVGLCSILNGPLYSEGIGGTNMGPSTLY